MPLVVDRLAGYVERGLDADLARWFPDAPPVVVPAPTRPLEPFLTRLPQDAATALAAFDRKVRAGTMRQCLDLASVEADFHSLAQPGALAPEIGLLASMS